MSYVKNILTKRERLVSMTRLHWIYIVQGLFWFCVFCGLGFLLDHLLYTYGGGRANIYHLYPDFLLPYFKPFSPLALIFFAAGIMVFLTLLIKYFDTEIVLTTRRIIYKRGLIRVEIDEADLGEIRAEHINHGLLGYFLGYGRVHLDCRFVEDIELPAIRKPLKLIKAIQSVKAEQVDEDDLEKDLKSP
ncbi:MAG: hypothetical protein CMH27_11195 [Micavibrio sp.]|nr:hypothetical protein [Micavibrio sp.]MCD8570526.1 hypothetical protein [Alphaproteobacteria bacterium]